MSTIKVSEATRLQLAWLVAKCEGITEHDMGRWKLPILEACTSYQYSPSTDWAQGGPIIEREQIDLGWVVDHWQANKPYNYNKSFHGSDPQHPLIAAMRCFVASKLGDEVEVPEELT